MNLTVNSHSFYEEMTSPDTTIFDGSIIRSPIFYPSIVSSELLVKFRFVLDLWISSIISYLGILDNAVIIMVFAKMGFKETMNISLTCIAFWDLVKCLNNAIMRMYGPIKLISPALAESWSLTTIFVQGNLSEIAGFASGVVASYVAVERCLCVSLPFKVKVLLTRKVVTVTNVLLSLEVVASHVIVFSVKTFTLVYNPKYNQTIVITQLSSFYLNHPKLYLYTQFMAIAYPFLTFLVMCVCTVIIIHSLRKASSVKLVSTGKDQSKLHGKRDRQIEKMLLVVILVYIVTYIPRLCYYTMSLFVPGFAVGAGYSNLMWMLIYCMFFFDLANASVNAFILYFMSSQFRTTLHAMIGVNSLLND